MPELLKTVVRCEKSEECRSAVPIDECKDKITLRVPKSPGNYNLNQNDQFTFKASYKYGRQPRNYLFSFFIEFIFLRLKFIIL